MQVFDIRIADIRPYERNAKRHPKKQVDLLAKNITRFGFTTPLLVDGDNNLIAGHGRLLALQQLGRTEAPAVRMEGLSEKDVKALRLADNKVAELGEWDMDLVIGDLKELDAELAELTGFEIDPFIDNQEGGKSLADRFLFPPFSVLDARQGAWQERKRAWLSLGIKSEEGRKDDLAYRATDGDDVVSKKIMEAGGGTSVFDPTLCEVLYSWFAPKRGSVLDPFAGGSVRGVVATKLGLRYTGIELRAEQVEANRRQAMEIFPDGDQPAWICGDSAVAMPTDQAFDFLFSCPPYADLEVYSDNPADISNMPYEAFLAAYRDIIKRAVARLKDDRFACFVVGEVRDNKGNFRDFVGDTVQAFRDAGMQYYNEAILVTMVGSLPFRTAKAFNAGRKLGKTHQNVLVFYKGNPKNIKETYGELDLSGIDELSPEPEAA